MTIRRTFALLGAGVLALQAQTAMAQQTQCVTEAEVSAALIYVVPIVIDGVSTRCKGKLSASGFFARRGTAMAARYEPLQAASWPKARSLLLKFAAQGTKTKGSPILDVLASAPPETLRPLVDAMILQQIATKMDLKDCSKVEKIAAALEPLEPAAVGNLTAALFSVAEVKNPTICPA